MKKEKNLMSIDKLMDSLQDVALITIPINRARIIYFALENIA